MINKQIELEKQMTQNSIDNFILDFKKSSLENNLGNTKTASKIILDSLDSYKKEVERYIEDYSKGNAIRSTSAARIINLFDIDVVCYISIKVILNHLSTMIPVQSLYRKIGQSLEDEFKMQQYKEENNAYYKAIQSDLNDRGAKVNRKRIVTSMVFKKRLDFFVDKWTISEKVQVGLILANLFLNSTGLIKFMDVSRRKKVTRFITATENLVKWIENINNHLKVMQPFYLPMICQPKEWTGIFDGGYISPYLKKNKLIKNNSREYLEKLKTAEMPSVYEAVNYLQNTAWQINKQVFLVMSELWEKGILVAGLPNRENEELPEYPYPNKEKNTYTEEEVEVVKKWKRKVYDIHKSNAKKVSLRISTAQILKIADQFKSYEKIYFPHQMDFRGRLYPIPVLLHPQGNDLAKGLLTFSEGKQCDKSNIRWLEIHGANMWGEDKGSYNDRISWVRNNKELIKSYAEDPYSNLEWSEADKPFQFLAFCFEYRSYLEKPDSFITHLPVQLDGTCNGLQHYSAILKDPIAGKAVNLVDSEIPADIYLEVANKLEDKLKNIVLNKGEDYLIASKWLQLGINRKITKKPVMILPYGGTMISCREYIVEYLLDNYSKEYLFTEFKTGTNAIDCVFKIAVWLSKYLWEAIKDTLQSAIICMDYIKEATKLVINKQNYVEWLSPIGLLIHQEYKNRKHKEIKTELFGSILKTRINEESNEQFKQKQINGICPNFIHSQDAACLMYYLLKCKDAGINSVMTVHDCYGVLAPDTEKSARFLRESFVEIYKTDVLDNFVDDIMIDNEENFDKHLEYGELDIEDVLSSKYFFN